MGKLRSNLADAQTFEALPKDWYSMHIDSYEFGDSKASIARGAPEKMFTFTWIVDEGEFVGRKVPFHTISLSQKAAGIREDFYDAIKMPRTCLSCGNEFTAAKKVTKEESKINKAGLACPNCNAQGETEVDVGEPTGQAFVGMRALVGVTVEPSNKPGDTRSYNRVEGLTQIK